MESLVNDAMEAGAIGLSTGRSDFHKSSDGGWTPASEAGKDELEGLARAVAASGHGVLQAVNDFDMVRPGETFDTEFDLMEAFFRAGKGRPGSMSLMERDFAPEDWKNIIRRTDVLNDDGLDISFQVAPRAIGAINGLNCTFHPIMAHPSYLAISDLSLAERVEKLSDPAFKAKLLSETPVQLSGDDSPVPPLVDMMIATFPQLSEKIFPMNIGWRGACRHNLRRELPHLSAGALDARPSQTRQAWHHLAPCRTNAHGGRSGLSGPRGSRQNSRWDESRYEHH